MVYRKTKLSFRNVAEYDVYLQNRLTAKLKQKNARTAVRRDFIVAHPRPKMRMIFENITNFRAIPLHQSDNIPKRIGNSYDHYGKFAEIMYLYYLESRKNL